VTIDDEPTPSVLGRIRGRLLAAPGGRLGRVVGSRHLHALIASASVGLLVVNVGVVVDRGGSHHHRPAAASAVSAGTVTGETPTTPPSPAHVVKHVRPHNPWGHLMVAVPPRWTHPRDVHLSLNGVAKRFQHPTTVRRYLRTLGYKRGVDRIFYRPTPRIAIDEQAWQFRTADGADGWYRIWLAANAPHHGSTFGKGFAIRGVPTARGLLGRSRDNFGFSYGVAVVRAGDLVIHLRYSSLAAVSRVQVTKWMRIAARNAGVRAAGRSVSAPATVTA
jgi:hypothetical protein